MKVDKSKIPERCCFFCVRWTKSKNPDFGYCSLTPEEKKKFGVTGGRDNRPLSYIPKTFVCKAFKPRQIKISDFF